MSSPAGVQPIIVIKKKGGHGGHHGGAWKVAYADFVTAMMALFLVMWLMNATPEVKKAVSSYFKDPQGTGKKTGTNVANSGESVTLNKNTVKDLKDKLEEAIKKQPEFQKLKNNVEMTITPEGLRIELLETEKGMFFNTGAAVPTDVGKDLLVKLASELVKLKNNPLMIEGHTDSIPYGKAEYSNWELSTDRANAARRILQETGMAEHQITQVRGFADQRLRVPTKPDDASNRRVSIIVGYATPVEPDEPEKGEGKKGEGHEGKGEKKSSEKSGKDERSKGAEEKAKPAEKDAKSGEAKPVEHKK